MKQVIQPVTVFIADDGKKFFTEKECKEHEELAEYLADGKEPMLVKFWNRCLMPIQAKSHHVDELIKAYINLEADHAALKTSLAKARGEA